jgi:chemotaxis methyl-accepting protein methylase
LFGRAGTLFSGDGCRKWLLENPGAAFQNYRIRASDLNSEYLTVARQGIYTLKKKERSLLQLYAVVLIY